MVCLRTDRRENTTQRHSKNTVPRAESRDNLQQHIRPNKMVCLRGRKKCHEHDKVHADGNVGSTMFLAISCHILNRSPTTIYGDVTPAEKWTKHKPSVEHQRVFECVAFAFVPYERKIKLDEKSIVFVMFGVSKDSKAYRLYDPATKQIIINKDVKFDESRE